MAILNKTHYGTTIYSHILREYYPDEVVMTITGKDCGLCRNPFNSNKETLHIWISKTDPTNVMSSEVSCHEDMQNAIPAGDAFAFFDTAIAGAPAAKDVKTLQRQAHGIKLGVATGA